MPDRNFGEERVVAEAGRRLEVAPAEYAKFSARLLWIMAALWLGASGPVKAMAGWDGVAGLTLAAMTIALSLAVSLVIVPVVGRAAGSEVWGVLLGSGLRMAVAGGVSVAVVLLRPDWGWREFFGGLVVFYLLGLVAETAFLVKLSARSSSGAGRNSISEVR